MTDSLIKIYKVTEMGGSPFHDKISIGILDSYNCILTNKISDANIVVSHNYKKLLPFILLYPKKIFLVWTNEPRYDTTFKQIIKFPLGLPGIHILNVYGKDVFWHNLHFLSSYHFYNRQDLGIPIDTVLPRITKESFNELHKKEQIAAFFTNTLDKKSRLMKDGSNIDLSEKRCRYAIAGHKRNLVDIYGNKWPEGYAIDNSGFGFDTKQPWWIEKIQLLKNYKFNLCLENTASPYYVTEKIWHAIYSYSLPIYSSFNSTIYETFPKESFIDTALFKDENELFEFIESMSMDEYIRRLNSCIDAFNNAINVKRKNYDNNTTEIIRKIVARIRNI